MANINQKWRKIAGCGCSHGHLIDRKAERAFLKFLDEYKPETRVHHGDWSDMTAFRSGAHGTADEAANVGLDLRSGIRFVEAMRATHLLNGNHDIRPYKLLNSPNAVLAHAAGCVINEMAEMTKRLNCKWIQKYKCRNSWFEFGDTKVMHGWYWGMNAVRQHVNTYGRCIHTHIHTIEEARGIRSEPNAVAYSAGYLADEDKLEYAHARPATLRHQQGFWFGEYSSKECKIWLAEINNGKCHLPPR